MPSRVLVMGLPGAGKTTLCEGVKDLMGDKVAYFNADQVREQFDDWDFSLKGRERQAERMRMLADLAIADGQHAICDFVCPTVELRQIFEPDVLIFVDTIAKGEYEDTNKIFEAPECYTVHVTTQNRDYWKYAVENAIQPYVWNNKAPTAQMLGRWQPWHDGHQALFEEAIEKTGQVQIMVRDVQGTDDKNPFDFYDVEERVSKRLRPVFGGRFRIIKVPNITNIVYGRDVGYKIEEIDLPDHIKEISATKIRKQMGI